MVLGATQDLHCAAGSHFATAEEGALVYSRYIGREAATKEAEAAAAAIPVAEARAEQRASLCRSDVDMTAEEALAAAAAEGLPLVRSCGSNTGFRHVTRVKKETQKRPYVLYLQGKLYGASFATAEAAALAYP